MISGRVVRPTVSEARRGLAVGAAGVGLTLLCGCAQEPRPSANPTPDAAAFAGAGAWAGDFAEAASGASSYERKILADGSISAAELSDSRQRMRSCMHDFGYRYTEHADGTTEAEPTARGSVTDVDDADADERMLECSRRFDRNVSLLYDDTRRNPEKQDEAEIAVVCLRRAGLVNGSYSERRWRSEYDAGAFSFDEWAPAAIHCRNDPLELVEQG